MTSCFQFIAPSCDYTANQESFPNLHTQEAKNNEAIVHIACLHLESRHAWVTIMRLDEEALPRSKPPPPPTHPPRPTRPTHLPCFTYATHAIFTPVIALAGLKKTLLVMVKNDGGPPHTTHCLFLLVHSWPLGNWRRAFSTCSCRSK